MLKDFDLCDDITTGDSTPADDTQVNYCQDNSKLWTEDNILEHKAVQETIKVMTVMAMNEEGDKVDKINFLVDVWLNISEEMTSILWRQMGVDSEDCYTYYDDPHSEHVIAICSRIEN